MISKEHKKHSDIERPTLGTFGRNEFAFVGTACGNIQQLTAAIITALKEIYKCAYIDADHANADAEMVTMDALAKFTNKISYRELQLQGEPTSFEYRQLFNAADLILVNGNHFEAAAQVIVIDEVKKASLQKRLQQLTNPQLILLNNNVDGIFDFVKEAIPNWQQLPVLSLHETDNIIDFFKRKMQEHTPVLKGLVLAGGKSVRMGFDKTVIQWHGIEQRVYMASLLKNICSEVYISCRPEQQNEIKDLPVITDSFTGLGPYGAILSAFRQAPNSAWMVIASDLPLMDAETLSYLAMHRNTSAIATTFESPHDGFPEPLITIWEPKSYMVLLNFLSQGYTCPRKVLRNNDAYILKAPHAEKLMNVNTEEELQQAEALLHKKAAHS